MESIGPSLLSQLLRDVTLKFLSSAAPIDKSQEMLYEVELQLKTRQGLAEDLPP